MVEELQDMSSNVMAGLDRSEVEEMKQDEDQYRVKQKLNGDLLR